FPSTIAVQRDTPIGTALATVQTRFVVTCDDTNRGSKDAAWDVYLSPSNPDFGPASVASTRATNYDGIGMKWLNMNSNTGATQTVSDNPFNSATWKRGIALKG